jgi:hypothetical protein
MRMSLFKKSISLAVFTLLLIGCAKDAVWQKAFDSSQSAAWQKTTLDSSKMHSPTERIAVLKKIMAVEAPSPIIDVQYIQYQIGDNFLGPADYQFYAKIVIEQKNISKWRRELQPKIPPTEFTTSPSGISWWLSGQEKENFEFYSPKLFKLYGGGYGFVAISLKNEGVIYVFTYTM